MKKHIIRKKKMIPEVKLYDFNVFNRLPEEEDSDDGFKQDDKQFVMQMFGMDEQGKDYSIFVDGFNPFFYVKVGDSWKKKDVEPFIKWLKGEISSNPKSSYYDLSIVSSKCKLIKRETLYGFDKNKLHKFVYIEVTNTTVFNKLTNLWYNNASNFMRKRLKKKGLEYKKGKNVELIQLYEAKLPPLLRCFHMQDISPTGWITFDKHVKPNKSKKSKCKYEYETKYTNIVPLHDKESPVPLKILSFDIEASSSHGDFPLAKKTYRKMLGEIIEYWTKNRQSIKKMTIAEKNELFTRLVLMGFGFDKVENANISQLYPKKKPNKTSLLNKLEKLLNKKMSYLLASEFGSRCRLSEEEKKEKKTDWAKPFIPSNARDKTLIYLLSIKYDAGKKLDLLDKATQWRSEEFLRRIKERKPNTLWHKYPGYLPELEGDKCTFIGSTFMKMGEKEQYLNHMIVLDTCDEMPNVPNSELVSCKDEKDVLLEWTKLIERENPDIIIGYNIFGFDWKFLVERSEELNCFDDFCMMSKNKNEECMVKNSVIKIASGTHDLKYIKINGRIQVDLYNYFRKDVNLPSYKLDSVASHFIGDYVKKYDYDETTQTTCIYSENLQGLKNGHYICFELIGYSSDMYKNGAKFIITNLDLTKGCFDIKTQLNIEKKKIRWCLAKDDVSPQDIFRMTNEGPAERALVAKYCIQDCNLVHNLMIKNDILTTMIEQASICRVPVDYIVMRGQGIKLLSFIARFCRMNNTLMPVIRRGDGGGSYEGAICLKPKCGLYINQPVAVVDYSSLYPSCMISENISHDSKVWTKEYDLDGKLLKETGIKNENGDGYKYDNLETFRYVNITYDRYEWKAPPGRKAEVKTKVGTKTCRYAQFPNDKKAIMPRVLQELLAKRKATKKFKKYKTVVKKNGESVSGLLTKTERFHIVKDAYGKDEISIANDEVEKVETTYDDFMVNVFDKRQLGYKVVANSLYGQCGGKTSSFFEMDIAASTTATGRKLLLYGKRVIEECYGDTVIETKKHGKVKSNAEYIYGDTDSVFFAFNLTELDGTKIEGQKALEITIEKAIEAGELATKFLKAPHDLEYEKTFDPFLLLSKKRYVGMLYETDINKCKRKSMGIVLKRRDNCNAVKDIYGGLVDILMNEQNVGSAVDFVKKFLENMVNEKYGLDKLIISKSLRGFYKNPDSIAHKVLADRMGKREPGNKPSVGSRIPYVYIQTKGEVKLQGDRIESPEYIKKHKLKPDYTFYITNQIMKPVMQVFSLILEDIPTFRKRNMIKEYARKEKNLHIKYVDDKGKVDMEKIEKKTKELRNKYVKELIFESSLRKANNSKKNQHSIMSFFKKK
jgi:DNA polymerase elongation subunit (family B)